MSTRRFALPAALASVVAIVLALGALALSRNRRQHVTTEPTIRAATRQIASAGRRAGVIVLTLIAVGLMCLSAWLFISATTLDDAVLQGGLTFVLGAIVLALIPKSALLPAPERSGEQDSAGRPSASAIERYVSNGLKLNSDARPVASTVLAANRIRWRLVGLGVVLLALVTAASNNQNSGLTVTLGARGQYLCWLGGIVAVAWGLSGLRRLPLPRLDRREAVLLAAILALALALRLYGLDQLRVMVDETHFSTGALYFFNNAGPQLLRPIGPYDPFPRIVTYWVAEAVSLFGHTFAALRVVPALIGTATVGALYLLGRELFDRQVGLAAAALLATFPPFLHFSRLAVISVIDPLFGLLTLAFLTRAFRRGSRTDYVVAGVMLGLTQYFHEAGRLLFPALVAAWLIGLLLTRTKISPVSGTTFGFNIRWPFAWRGLALGLLATLMVAAPLVITQRTQPEQIKTRLDYAVLPRQYWQALLITSDFRPQLNYIRDAALTLVRTQDATQYYAGTTPLILPLFVPLFLLGIASIPRRRPPRGAWVITLWVVLTMLGNSILTVPSTSVHFMVVFPALTLLMALGLNDTLRLLTRRRATWLLAVLVIAVGVGQTYYYFGPHLELYNTLMRAIGSTDAYDVLLRAADLPPHTEVHLIADPTRLPMDEPYAQEVLRYLNDRVTIDLTAPDDVNEPYLEQLSHSVPQAFFAKPSATRAIERIVHAFPSDSQPQHTPYLLTGETYLLYLVLPQAAGS